MMFGVFLFYFLLFVFIFSTPEKWKQKNKHLKQLFTVPAIIALIMVLLTVLKVYFIYKLFILLFLGFTFLLSYWQWGDQMRQWWNR